MKNFNPFEKAPGRLEQICPKCSGTGKDHKGKKCDHCNGTGKILR